jgi:hypothetical protein
MRVAGFGIAMDGGGETTIYRLWQESDGSNATNWRHGMCRQ